MALVITRAQRPSVFVAAHRDRITVEPLPSYAPDDNPIAYLWKKTKKRATHNQYFEACAL
jgi:transposase